MFQTTRRRLALWYTTVTAILLLLFATGFSLYVRTTLIERIDDTLNHVVEVVQRSLVVEPVNFHQEGGDLRINIEASFRDDASAAEDDHIDLEWFSSEGKLLWSTLSEPLDVPLHPNVNGETVRIDHGEGLLRQVTQKIQVGRQVLGYLRVSHPWFEVTKPVRQLIFDLSLGTTLMVGVVAAVGWLLSGLAMEPVRESYQRLKQFTADASHELRNPIATIQTNVQVALADPEPDLQLQQHQLRVVERLTRRLGRLVDDLLFLARQDSGIVQARSSTLALDDLLAEVLEEQQLHADDKAIALSLQVQTPGLMVQGDRDQLARLFTNLVANAVQYTPQAGQVEVELYQLLRINQSQVQVKIKDSGIGIPEDSLPHIFDRFYRVDPARSHAPGGTQGGVTTGSGLGLAIAQAIVENHQGQITVESQVDKGTTFTVTLPEQG